MRSYQRGLLPLAVGALLLAGACGESPPPSSPTELAATSIESIEIVAPVVRSGNGTVVHVTLTSVAALDTQVRLESSHPLQATPYVLFVPAGARVGGTEIVTRPADEDVDVTITAVLGSERKSGNLRLLACSLTSVEAEPAAVVGGQATRGVLRLRHPVGRGGMRVLLESEPPGFMTMPDSVLVPEGATSAVFPIVTLGVVAEQAITVWATLAATPPSPYGQDFRKGTVTITPAAALPMSFRFVTEPRYQLTRGRSETVTSANASFTALSQCRGAQVHVRITESSGAVWNLDFSAPNGDVIRRDITYETYRDWESRPEPPGPYGPRLGVTLNGQRCDNGGTVSGSFRFHELLYGRAESLNRMQVEFQHSCSGARLSGQLSLSDARLFAMPEVCSH